MHNGKQSCQAGLVWSIPSSNHVVRLPPKECLQLIDLRRLEDGPDWQSVPIVTTLQAKASSCTQGTHAAYTVAELGVQPL